MSIGRNLAVMAPLGMGILISVLLVASASIPAAAQQTGFNTLVQEANSLTSARIVQLLVVMTVLSVAPGLLMMVTSFARFIIALSFLRSGLGLQTTPSKLFSSVLRCS